MPKRLTKKSKAARIAPKTRYKGRNRIKAMPRAMISSPLVMRNYSFTSRYYNIPTNLSRVALWETSFLLRQILILSGRTTRNPWKKDEQFLSQSRLVTEPNVSSGTCFKVVAVAY